MVHATTLFEVSRGEIHGRQFALFIKFMQCFFKVSASATADDCIALHCIALVFTCKILMINKRGRCFNHDPVSPSKTLLERMEAWKATSDIHFEDGWQLLQLPAASMGAAPRAGTCCAFPCKAFPCLALPRLKYEPRSPEISSISL